MHGGMSFAAWVRCPCLLACLSPAAATHYVLSLVRPVTLRTCHDWALAPRLWHASLPPVTCCTTSPHNLLVLTSLFSSLSTYPRTPIHPNQPITLFPLNPNPCRGG